MYSHPSPGIAEHRWRSAAARCGRKRRIGASCIPCAAAFSLPSRRALRQCSRTAWSPARRLPASRPCRKGNEPELARGRRHRRRRSCTGSSCQRTSTLRPRGLREGSQSVLATGRGRRSGQEARNQGQGRFRVYPPHPARRKTKKSRPAGRLERTRALATVARLVRRDGSDGLRVGRLAVVVAVFLRVGRLVVFCHGR